MNGTIYHTADNPQPNLWAQLMNSVVQTAGQIIGGGNNAPSPTPAPVVVAAPTQAPSPKWLPYAIGSGVLVFVIALVALIAKK